MNYLPCAKCDGGKTISDVRVVDRTMEEDWLAAVGDLTVEVETKPNARFLKGIVGVPLVARVCGDCGHTEFYVTDPAKLVEAYEQRAANAR